LVNIQFHKKTRIRELCLYIDFKFDESYTPAVISIRAGSSLHDLQEVVTLELDEPSGWITVPLRSAGSTGDLSRDRAMDSDDRCLRAHVVQLAVLQSHQNGRDTHIRQIKTYGPRISETKGMGTELTHFSSIEFMQFASLR